QTRQQRATTVPRAERIHETGHETSLLHLHQSERVPEMSHYGGGGGGYGGRSDDYSSR
ncbi:unnamed protein product, partial [Ectocarpus sp. 4 AP-2014]